MENKVDEELYNLNNNVTPLFKMKKIVITERFAKYVIVSFIGTLITYLGGILLVDIIGLPYWFAGLMILPITFVIGFILNSLWVFKQDEKD